MMTISLSFPLILASASPRRKELLRSVGLKFKIIASDIDESYIAGESPQDHVRRLSRAKPQRLRTGIQRPWFWVPTPLS